MSRSRGLIYWCLFDWANSAFPTLITTFIFSTYFIQAVATDPITGTSLWGYAQGIAALIIACISPILGVCADRSGHNQRYLLISTLICIIACCLLWFAYPTPSAVLLTLGCVVVGTIGFETGMIFYNAMLVNLVPKAWMGRLSGWGWGIGYLGGLACLCLALYGFINQPPSWLNQQMQEHIRIIGPIVGLWFALFGTPLLLMKRSARQPKSKHNGVRQLLLLLWQDKLVLKFLIARMFYHDGLVTIFAFGGIYAAGTFGLNMIEVLQLGILLNIAAGLGAILFGWLDDRLGARTTIILAIIGLLIPGVALIFITSVTFFWLLACTLSLFVGPIQAASRSYLAKQAPKHLSNELFALLALSGKVTAFIGPWLFALATQLAQTQRAGFACVLGLLVLGLGLLTRCRNGPLRR